MVFNLAQNIFVDANTSSLKGRGAWNGSAINMFLTLMPQRLISEKRFLCTLNREDKTLDLHCLFLKSPLERPLKKVIRDRRKYYLSLLYRFGQVYFVQKQNILMVPPARYAANKSRDMGSRKVKKDEIMGEPEDCLDPQIGSTVIGTIDEKFNEGYLITVYIGSKEYTGVLYHVPDFFENDVDLAPPQGQKRSRIEFMDSDSPESNAIGYNFFFVEQYEVLKQFYNGEESSICDEIGVLWNNLTEVEKKKYEEQELQFNILDGLMPE